MSKSAFGYRDAWQMINAKFVTDDVDSMTVEQVLKATDWVRHQINKLHEQLSPPDPLALAAKTFASQKDKDELDDIIKRLGQLRSDVYFSGMASHGCKYPQTTWNIMRNSADGLQFMEWQMRVVRDLML